jgi:hypothetical protein
MLGLVFFYKVQTASIKQDFQNFQNEKTGVDFVTLGDMPEFSCSKLGEPEGCIDSSKLIVFMKLNSTKKYRDYYFSRFGYKNITIQQIYPETTVKKCSVGDYIDCNFWEIYVNKPRKDGGKRVYRTPVSLYFPEKNEYRIGMLVVEAYYA